MLSRRPSAQKMQALSCRNSRSPSSLLADRSLLRRSRTFSRVARTNAAKRTRLAAAVANQLPWSSFSSEAVRRFTMLVEDLGDFHVWLLHFLDHKTMWAPKNRTTNIRCRGSLALISSHGGTRTPVAWPTFSARAWWSSQSISTIQNGYAHQVRLLQLRMRVAEAR